MKINQDFVLKEIANEFVIIPVGEAAIDFRGMMTVNKTGKFIFEVLKEEVTKENLIQQFIDKYEVTTDVAMKDIDVFLDKLRKHKILIG